jgi:hypothetical protein
LALLGGFWEPAVQLSTASMTIKPIQRHSFSTGINPASSPAAAGRSAAGLRPTAADQPTFSRHFAGRIYG